MNTERQPDVRGLYEPLNYLTWKDSQQLAGLGAVLEHPRLSVPSLSSASHPGPGLCEGLSPDKPAEFENYLPGTL